MIKKRRYTREEDEAIFRAVKDSTTSMKSCFIAVAQQLNRSQDSVEQRWYTYLSNPESPHYMGTAMILMKEHRAAQNRTTFKFPVETKTSIWTKLKRLLGL